MSRRTRIKLIPLMDEDVFEDALALADDCTLADFLQKNPALSTSPLSHDVLSSKLSQMMLLPVSEANPGHTPLYRPPNLRVNVQKGPSLIPKGKESDSEAGRLAAAPAPNPPIHSEITPPNPLNYKAKGDPPQNQGDLTSPPTYAQTIDDLGAVALAYGQDIGQLAAYIRQGLSVLIHCDKVLVPHLYPLILKLAGRTARRLLASTEGSKGLLPRSGDQQQMKNLKDMVRLQKKGEVLVLSNLDLLAGATSGDLSGRARSVIETLFDAHNRQCLAFADASLQIPEVLAKRFSIQKTIAGLPRQVRRQDGQWVPVANALVQANEAELFAGFDPAALYKNIAGMNAIELRRGMAFARAEHAHQADIHQSHLIETLREFKAQTSEGFVVPDVSFDDIGGYNGVKSQVERVIHLLEGAYALPNEALRHELIPRGLIFHGPPGTGKTLFAKAIAGRLNATIQVVSGPEVTDMYVGESERKIRQIFAKARRNAPAVIVFDEFDAIATRRAGRNQGGSRAGNAVVAQILTEMDGFRPDVPLLVIGTTNRIDIIDEALLRPSRFRPIPIPLPDAKARMAIAKVHNRRFLTQCDDGLLTQVAQNTEGMNGDQIRALFRDLCVRRYCDGQAPEDDGDFITQSLALFQDIMKLSSAPDGGEYGLE